MTSQEQTVHPKRLWSALPFRQRERLLTLLGNWAMRVWETEQAACASRIGREEDEPGRRQDQT
jgi:hypothetical protein